ncbi:MAG: alcohol dehydrogenase catalytic domain-containing protein [Chloroflexi bacterium]|nr:alcohol dehydrogenase catalytic domain-containing protein [Chloroflexota bacterium]
MVEHIRGMWAAFLCGRLDVRVEDAAVPQVEQPDDVLIQVKYTGICGSELHSIEGYEITKGGAVTANTHAALGHEYSGVIVDVGPAVKRFTTGQRVTAWPRGPCGHCDLCRNHLGALCRKVTQRGGSWAEYIVAPEALVYALPDDVPFTVGAITEPLSCAVRILDRASMRPGQTVYVIGAGPIGLFSAVVAKHAGAGLLIVSEPRDSRRDLAHRMGADVVVNPREHDLRDVVLHHTRGRGVDVSIEGVGLEPALSQAIEVVAIGGTVLWGGLAPTDLRVPVSPNDMFMKEYTLRTSWGGLLEFDRTLRLEQVIDWSPMVQEVFPLERAMDAVNYARTQAAGKVLLRTTDSER